MEDRSGHYWTSTASARLQWALSDLNGKCQIDLNRKPPNHKHIHESTSTQSQTHPQTRNQKHTHNHKHTHTTTNTTRTTTITHNHKHTTTTTITSTQPQTHNHNTQKHKHTTTAFGIHDLRTMRPTEPCVVIYDRYWRGGSTAVQSCEMYAVNWTTARP